MQQFLIPDGFNGSWGLYVFVTLIAFLITGVSKGGFGGVGILSIPLMMMVVPDSGFVLGMWLPLLILCDIFTIRSFPKAWELRPILLLAPWMVIGVVLGRILMGHVDSRHVKLFVGGLSLVFVLLEIVRLLIVRRMASATERPPWRPSLWTAAPFGLLAGVSTMIAHSAGAITTIYLLTQRLDKATFVGTSGRFYFVFNTLKVPFFMTLTYVNGASETMTYISGESLLKSLWLVPLAPLGVWGGAWLNRRISTETFNKAIYVLLAISGLYLIVYNA
jgi:uncharacterized membrane protein YfcA